MESKTWLHGHFSLVPQGLRHLFCLRPVSLTDRFDLMYLVVDFQVGMFSVLQVMVYLHGQYWCNISLHTLSFFFFFFFPQVNVV